MIREMMNLLLTLKEIAACVIIRTIPANWNGRELAHIQKL